MEIIDFNDWKNKNIKNEFHLKVNKQFEDLNDLEVRQVLEKVVKRADLSLDKIYDLYQSLLEVHEIIDSIVKKQNSIVEKQNLIIEKQSELAKLAISSSELLRKMIE